MQVPHQEQVIEVEMPRPEVLPPKMPAGQAGDAAHSLAVSAERCMDKEGGDAFRSARLQEYFQNEHAQMPGYPRRLRKERAVSEA